MQTSPKTFTVKSILKKELLREEQKTTESRCDMGRGRRSAMWLMHVMAAGESELFNDLKGWVCSHLSGNLI